MPFLDWVNKNQAKETSRDVPYHLLHFGTSSLKGDAFHIISTALRSLTM